MPSPEAIVERTLLCADLVDSTQRNVELGDAAMAHLWQQHDAGARELMRRWRGMEIARSDGFLVLFDQPRDAVAFAAAYHRMLDALEPPLAARVGIHHGPLSLRENTAEDRARGALPFEVDGVVLPVTARIGAAAQARQTLISAEGAGALGLLQSEAQSLGYWQFKGVAEPMELFEIVGNGALLHPPPDTAKGYRVVATAEGWAPAREIAHRLPAERDPFVGRIGTLARLAQSLAGQARLVTLLGMGGIGKTRLALRHARRWLGDYPGGAWFCDLAAARGLDGVVHAVAQGLDIALGKTDPVRQIAAAIASRGPCLVIVDNFEQVAVHARVTLGAWLAAAPEAKFIATSREVLGISGEQVLRVEPLDAAEGAELFHRRALAAGHGIAPLAGDAAMIAELVRMLDGLPLAIELAAARTPIMSLAMLLRRMHERFELLASRQGRDPRQATLRATLDWSWDLLEMGEQRALAQLAVFEGGFTLEAAEAVIETPAGDRALSVVDLLHSLLDKSLLKRGIGERLDMLVSVQQYAAEKLTGMAAGDESLAMAAEQRHFAYNTRRRDIDMELFAIAEMDNLVAACRRAVARGAAAKATRALEVAWAGLKLQGPLSTAVELVAAIRSIGAIEPPVAACLARISGSTLNELGQVAVALQEYEAGLELLRGVDDPPLEGQLRRCLGDLHALAGRMELAGEHLNAAIAIARRVGDAELECTVLNSLGSHEESLGQLDRAAAHYEQALGIARRARLRRWEAGSLGNLAQLQTAQGHHERAERLYEPAIVIAREVGDRRWEGNALCNLGLTLQALGRLDEARARLDDALAIARHLGQRRLEAVTLCNLGIVAQAMDDRASARAAFEQAIVVVQQLADRRAEGQFLGYLGLLELRTGSVDRAADVLQRAETLLEAVSDRLSLALVLCHRAELQLRQAAGASARKTLQRAEAMAREVGAGEPSELAAALTQLRGQLG